MLSLIRRMPIRAKLMLTIFTVATLVSAGGFMFIFFTEIDSLRKDAVQTAKSYAAVISQDLVRIIVIGGVEESADVAAKLDSLPRILESYVYNNEGEFVFSYLRDRSQMPSPPKLQSGGISLKPMSIDLFHPVTYQGTRYGTIFIRLSTQDLLIRETEYYRLLVVVILIFMVLFYISGYWIQRFFSRPIVSLSEGVSQIANEQDYSKRLFTVHQDEVGTLYRSFNQLLEVIEASRHSLEQNMARTDSILNLVGNAIIVIDDDCSILQFNRQAEEIFGYRASEVLGRSLDVLLPERFRLNHKNLVYSFGGESEVMRAAMQRNYVSGMRKDGQEFPVEASISKINFDGHWIYTVALNDITKRLQVEQELERYRLHLEDLVNERTNELRRAYKEMETFSYSVSHDLRAPLRRIDGFSKVLLEDHLDQLDEDGQNYLKRIRSSTRHMSALIDDMLSLARISRKEMQTDTTDLSKLCRDIVGHIQEGNEHRRIEFNIQDTPPCECDPGMMRIALGNLLQNAWNYTSKTDRATIEFTHTLGENDQVVYEIRDNGVGFDMQYADKLFRVFERLHDNDEFKGTGIGLATVHRIIERHGGRIWAEGMPGEGAVFYFTLGKCELA